jgi:hypothetical protein
VALDDRVRAWRVHDIDVTQPLDGVGEHRKVSLCLGFAGMFAVPEQMDLGSGGCHPLDKGAAAQQGVDECRLTGVELAHDHEQEQLVQLHHGAFQGGQIFLPGFEACQRLKEPRQQVAFGQKELFLFIGQEASQHPSPRQSTGRSSVHHTTEAFHDNHPPTVP